MEPGEFAVRGGIIDIFPFSSQVPYRIEFFGDEISELEPLILNLKDLIKILSQ